VNTQISTPPRSTAKSPFHSAALVVETTQYGQFERLVKLLNLVVEARLAVGELDGLERVGLRYIDEIRVPETNDNGVGWEPWLDASLLGPAPVGAGLGLRATQWTGQIVFSKPAPIGDEAGGADSLVLRYGPNEGYAVDPGGELKRSAPPPGLFFLLDIDSFWTSADAVPSLDPNELVRIAERLHAPVRDLFESLITQRLRDEVLRDAQ